MSNSFRRKRGRPIKQLPSFTPTLKAQGSADGPLRTPRNFADPDAGKSEYAVHEIVAHILKKGADFYKVRWTGLDERSDTTEPVAHLSDDASKAKIQAYLDGRAALEPPSKAVRLAEVRSGESVVDEGASTDDTIYLDGDSPAPRHAIKHSKISLVWKFCSPKFQDMHGKAATICNFCHEQLSAPNTTNIWNHLVRHHSSTLVNASVDGHKVFRSRPTAFCRQPAGLPSPPDVVYVELACDDNTLNCDVPDMCLT